MAGLKTLAPLAPLAYVDIYYGEYLTSAERTAYVTFDVVDKADVKERLAFRPKPRGPSASDPAGLLAAWKAYNDLGHALSSRGLIDSENLSCAGFYCPWGASSPELAAFDKKLAESVEGNEKKLLAIVQNDSDEQKRADALCILSYLKDGSRVAGLMLDSLADPSPVVRACALEVLSDIALFHKKVFLDVSRILPALDFPTVSDRSKALSVLVALVGNPSYRPYVTSRAALRLMELLRLDQPSNHDLAFTLLSMLSDQSYDQHDYVSWQRWADAQAAKKMVAPPRR
jgi:hypothetical protein